MRILIVGAGIAGMTLAALLRRRGVRPTVVERAGSFEHAGYMLGLWPLGSRVLHGLGLYERFVERSEKLQVYELRNGEGELIRRYPWETISQRYGETRNMTRPELVNLLREGLGDQPIRMGTAFESLEQRGTRYE